MRLGTSIFNYFFIVIILPLISKYIYAIISLITSYTPIKLNGRIFQDKFFIVKLIRIPCFNLRYCYSFFFFLEGEIGYERMLNGVLPKDIELWAVVLFQVTSVQGPSKCLIKLY